MKTALILSSAINPEQNYSWSLDYQLDLTLTGEQILLCSHAGDCEEDCRRVMELPEVASQLEHISPESLASCLSDYCDWDCSDHYTNLVRFVWIIAGDILEDEYYKAKTA